ncbi:MAG TPA: glycine cleavage T C-terminal barrel domain-containing protein [Acidimicrobiia bacterium]|nr:glycine cleavage T C-terminal barrel domain-containing protein [Acidimicrobiia bacterium]
MSDPLGVVEGVREAVTVEGPGAKDFLQGIVSQDLDVLALGAARRAFLLGPQGKLRALLWVSGEGDRFTLYTDAGIGARVAADLGYYKIRIKATISDPIPAYEVFGAEVGVAAPWPHLDRYLSTTLPSGLPFMARSTWDAWRIESGEPLMDRDVDEKTIPQETGLVGDAVSFSKGCYLGQELVARLDSRQGRVNRHLRGLYLEGSAPVGSTIAGEEGEVGVLTSAAWSERLQSDIGLALVHRRVEVDDYVTIAGYRARVADLPLRAVNARS